MRVLIFITAAIFVAPSVFAQSNEATQAHGALLSWDIATYDFGEIAQGEKVEYTFRFSNIGTEPLMITNVTTQCGCTAPKGWPRDPIAPGGKGEITLVFDSTGKFGRVNKVATVMSNAVNKDEGQILLSGSITAKKAGNK
jgi:hypothetical protein